MPSIEELFAGYPYLALLASVLTLSYFARKYDVFQPVYAFLAKKIKSKRAVVAIASAITGVLPIEGRVVVSAGLLSTMAPEGEKRKKFAVLDYLATHHFYFWSPIEKTVIVPIAVLGISYGTFIIGILPMLAAMIIATLFYIFGVMKEDDIDITIRGKREVQKIDVRKYFAKSVNTLFTVAVILLLGAFAKHYAENFEGLVAVAQTSGWTILVVLALIFGSFVLGSSGKYAGLLAVALPIYGVAYLPLLFTSAWAGYMLSPIHKCMIIGQRMFGASLKEYYKVVSFVTAIVFLVGIAATITQL